jgi:hypothetical protein
LNVAAIEPSDVAREQFIGARLRAGRLRRLAATLRPRSRRKRALPRPASRRTLWWMPAVSAAGCALLR